MTDEKKTTREFRQELYQAIHPMHTFQVKGWVKMTVLTQNSCIPGLSWEYWASEVVICTLAYSKWWVIARIALSAAPRRGWVKRWLKIPPFMPSPEYQSDWCWMGRKLMNFGHIAASHKQSASFCKFQILFLKFKGFGWYKRNKILSTTGDILPQKTLILDDGLAIWSHKT